MDVENDMHLALSKIFPLIMNLVKRNKSKFLINFFLIIIFFIKMYKTVLKNMKNYMKLIYILLLI